MNNDPNEQRNYQSYQQNENGQQQGGGYQQYPYGVPTQQPGFVPDAEAPMTVGQWFLTVFLTNLPCIGIILLFVWGFGNEEGKRSRANYCKAMLIFMLIGVVISFFGTLLMTALGFSVFGGLMDSFGVL